MAHILEIRGLPASIEQDSWWLDDTTEQAPERSTGIMRTPWSAGLFGLIALADFLFFDHPKGLSLAIFAAAIFGAVWVLRRPKMNWSGPASLLAVGSLPAVEHLQALSIVFLTLGLLGSLGWVALGDRATLAQIARTGGLILRSMPLRGARDLWSRRHRVAAPRLQPGATSGIHAVLRAWGFPLGGLLVLAALLIEANPILLHWTNTIHLGSLDPERALSRLLFWVGMALLIWPLLVPLSPQRQTYPRKPGPFSGLFYPNNWGVNKTSTGNALVTFNLLLAVQTALDALYLWGGASLPEGMSYATYAHRGAYPLLITALLAGGFALAAHPHLGTKSWLKPLLMLWLAQNVALVLSSLLRLELYTSVYGLTYLRVHAAIWMGVVAIGLMLVAWQIWRSKSNLWLLARCSALGLGVLYACAFVNFADLIVRSNLSRTGNVDTYYACQFGSMAAAALHDIPGCDITAPQIQGWRDWGFRSWRVLDNLAAMNPAADQAEVSHEHPRR
ncbi:DUF4153 domain-containing protein [Falsiruegeria mediterranea]|uniref:Uncharacterized protein n=1 Tax=Falsiruegeria mediterranea M17 TaxID=1200281 RepID=A0A2R8CFI2_9RHOB|nr:DUF4173 domain-containing protein [Falsiruegeria mediterranea]SPJ31179.1 hypothetical protein TRM7615_04720 [Falsiruegeria mediterranea M17]